MVRADGSVAAGCAGDAVCDAVEVGVSEDDVDVAAAAEDDVADARVANAEDVAATGAVEPVDDAVAE